MFKLLMVRTLKVSNGKNNMTGIYYAKPGKMAQRFGLMLLKVKSIA